MTALRFSANMKFLWPDLALDEQITRAKASGFAAVEVPWLDVDAFDVLPSLARRARLKVALMYVDGGDLMKGQRGLIGDRSTIGQFRRGVRVVLHAAAACDCAQINVPIGMRSVRYTADEQLHWAAEQVQWTAELAAAQGATVLVEPLSVHDVGPYLLSRTEEAVAFIDSIGLPNVRLLYDVYHMQRMEGDLTSNIERHWNRIAHVQIGDNPGRHHPGSGEINYRHLLQLLQDRNYEGYVGLEYRPVEGEQGPSFSWIEEMGHCRDSAGVNV